jgi:HEAT repeat protein
MKWLGSAVMLLLLAGLGAADDVGALVKQLQSKDVIERRKAASSLCDAGKDAKEAISSLSAALADKDPYVRRFSAKALGNLGEDASSSVGSLKALIDDEHDEVVDAAVDALGKMGKSAVPTLVKLVEDDKQKKDRRRTVAEMIAKMKASDVAAQAVPMLTKLLKEKDADLKMDAIQDLGRYGAEAKSAVPVLADMLKPNDNNVRGAVLNTLGQLGPEAKAAIPALEALRDSEKDQDKRFKKPAEDTLKKIQATKGS